MSELKFQKVPVSGLPLPTPGVMYPIPPVATHVMVKSQNRPVFCCINNIPYNVEGEEGVFTKIPEWAKNLQLDSATGGIIPIFS